MEIAFPQLTRELRVQVIRDILWYRGARPTRWRWCWSATRWGSGATRRSDDRPECFGGVRDPGILSALERGTGLLRQQTAPRLARAEGPSERSVERAHPMAWFLESLVILWYCVDGHRGSHVERDRPWYTTKVTPAFTDMLGALRLQMWEHKIYGGLARKCPAGMHQKATPHTFGCGLRSESLV